MGHPVTIRLISRYIIQYSLILFEFTSYSYAVIIFTPDDLMVVYETARESGAGNCSTTLGLAVWKSEYNEYSFSQCPVAGAGAGDDNECNGLTSDSAGNQAPDPHHTSPSDTASCPVTGHHQHCSCLA